MMSLSLAERAAGRLRVACVRVPSVRLDRERTTAIPTPLRVLHALQRPLSAPPEPLGKTYARLVTDDAGQRNSANGRRDLLPSGRPSVYVDEDLRPVAMPRFAQDASARERLWQECQDATGNPHWTW